MKIKINITKDILKESMYCTNDGKLYENKVGQNCAIGKAIYNLFGDRSWVGGTAIGISDKKLDLRSCFWETYIYNIDLPMEAQQFISNFDKSTPGERVLMDEFSFEIDVPKGLINEIGIDEVHQILKESKSLELVNN